jgi:hypothetical protein
MNENELTYPSKSVVYFLYNGLKDCYPILLFGDDVGGKMPTKPSYSGIESTELLQLVFNIVNANLDTSTNDAEVAAKKIAEWKRSWDQNQYPNATIPENLEDLIESLDEKNKQKAARYEIEQIKKQTLLESQKFVEQQSYAPLTPPAEVKPEKEVVEKMPDTEKAIFVSSKEAPQEIQISQEEFEYLKELAKTVHSKRTDGEKTAFTDQLAAAIIEKAPKNVKENIPDKQLEFTARIIAINLVSQLLSLDESMTTLPSPDINPAGVLASLANPNSPVLVKFEPDAQKREKIARASQEISTLIQKDRETVANLLGPILGENLTRLFYPEPDDLSISEQETPTTISYFYPYRLIRYYEETQPKRNDIYNLYQQGDHNQIQKLSQEALWSVIKKTSWYREKGQFVSKSLAIQFFQYGAAPTAGAFIGFKTGVLLSRWASLNTPLLTSGVAGFLPATTGAYSTGTIITPLIDFNLGSLSLKAATATKAGQTALGIGIKKGAKETVKVIAVSSPRIAAFLGTLGSLTGPIGAAVGAVIGWVVGKAIEIGSKVLKKASIFLTGEKNKELRKLAYFGMFFGGFGLFSLSSTALVKAAGIALSGTAGLGAVGEINLKQAGAKTASMAEAAKVGFTTFVFPAFAAPMLIAVFAIPLIIAIFLFIINSGAYVVPPPESLIVSAKVENPYMSVTKVANPSGPFENSDLEPDGIEIDYTITITAKKGTLSEVRLKDECKTIKENNPPKCPPAEPGIPGNLDEPVLTSKPFSFSYKRKYTPDKFQDTMAIDTITVTANAPGAENTSDSATESVIFGNPPADCPSIWPITPDKGYTSYPITQGPRGTASHTSYNQHEAIDIGTHRAVGFNIVATHNGVVKAAASSGYNGGYGKFVDIQSVCGEGVFVSRYAHLSVVSVAQGQQVNIGDTVGLSGSTGYSTGPHLHYGFYDETGIYPKGPYPNNDPYMWPIYIPDPGVSLSRFYGCPGSCGIISF